MASDNDFQPTLRLQSLSWLFGFIESVKSLVLPLIALFFFGTRDADVDQYRAYILPLFIVALLARAVWHQWTYRYGFGPRGLVIREGIIFRNVRQIEYARIENVDTERGPLHRLFGVAEVRVQTSTGGKPEAQISVLSLDAVQEVRERVFSQSERTGSAAQSAVAETPLLHLSTGELIRYGLIDNRGMVIVAAGAGVLHEAGLFSVSEAIVKQVMASSSVAGIVALGIVMQVVLALGAILAALIAVRMLSVVLALITLHDFKLTRHDSDLRARYGLLTRIALTLRTRRVQAVHQTESLLHRWFDRVSLNVDLASGASGGDEQGEDSRTKGRWLAPVCPSAAAPALIAAALPSLDLSEPPDWQPLASGARSRIFRRSALFSMLLLTGPAIWYLREGAIVVLICIPLAWVHAHLYVKHTRWALTKDAVLFRAGWLTRRLTIVPRDRVQSLNISESPFDRRSRMANLSVDTAGGGPMSAGIRIRYLTVDMARQLSAALYRTAGLTTTSVSSER